jgi:uncharacterized protein (DUF1015 family)
MDKFQKIGIIDYSIIADIETGIVIDGHHRFEALRRMNAILAPVHLVDYKDENITVRNWRENEPTITKEEIIRQVNEGKLYPPKTTRHDIAYPRHPVNIPLDILLG